MKLIILDRDGVINEDSDEFIKTPEEFIPIHGSIKAIARLNHAGYRVIIATNQSGIARKLLNSEMLNRIHEKLNSLLSEAGGSIDSIFFCPHGPNDKCDCRKPKPGLLNDIRRRLHVNLEGVPAIGDSLRDIQAAQAVNASPVLVRTGKGMRTIEKGEGLEGVPVYDDLASVVDDLLAGELVVPAP